MNLDRRQSSTPFRQFLRTSGAATRTALLLLVGVLLSGGGAARGIVIEVTPGPGIFPLPPPTLVGLMMATDSATGTLESLFTDDAILKFGIDVDPALPPTVLGYFDVDPVTSSFSYSAVATALVGDVSSAADASAVASLQAGTFVDMVTNDTTSDPSLRTRISTSKTYNSTLRLTRANQKALGLLSGIDGGAAADGVIKLNPSKFPLFDFDASDGIAPGKLDLAAILLHEFAHGMGFISGVDHIDFASAATGLGEIGPDFPHDYSSETIFTPLDLYRYSGESITLPGQPAVGAVLDWAAGSSSVFDNPYFSVDGGATHLALFSTGVLFGDGNQAQHWKDESLIVGPPIGLMDPDLASAELGIVTTFDVMALDAVGYNLVPEPSTWGLGMVGLALSLLCGGWRRACRWSVPRQ